MIMLQCMSSAFGIRVIRRDATFWSLSERSGHCSALEHIANSSIFPAQSPETGYQVSDFNH